MIRLLDKKEIAQSRAADKRKEIEEGIKIARKVDALRETASQEEVRLSKFRTETVKSVTEEISALTSKRELISNDVKTLEIERARLLVPLDAEWEKVKQEKLKLERAKGELEGMMSDVRSKESEVLRAEKLLRTEEARVADLKKSAIEDAEKAKSVLEKADVTMREAAVEKRAIADFSRNKEQELLVREAGIAARERANEVRAQSLDERERELNSRETLINDRYQTLLRDQKRNVIHNPQKGR